MIKRHIQKIIVVLLLINSPLCMQAQSTVSPQNVCYGSTKTYAVDTAENGGAGTTGSIYDWEVTGAGYAGIITRNNNSISINWGTTPAGNYVVNVVETTSGCLGAIIKLDVTIYKRPVISFADNNGVICQDNTSIITATVDPADSGTNYSYVWTVPTGAANPGNVSSFAAGTAGTYSVVATNIALSCSSDSSPIVLIVNPLPAATITVPSPGSITFCAGGSVELTSGTDAGASVTSTYQWKKDGVAITTGATGTKYVAIESGAYTVTVTNDKGCIKTSAAVTVTVNPLPSATITNSGPTTFCDGANILLTANTNSGTIFQWKRDTVAITGATATTYTAIVSGVYTVTITNSNGCVNTSNSVTVIVHPLPTATITPSGATTFCDGTNVVLTAGSDTGTVFQWRKAGTPILGQTNQTYTALVSGVYTVTITNGTTSCVNTSAPTTVVVNPIPITSAISHN
jgi:hypothetical protein